MNKHIRFAVAVDILKGQDDWYMVRIWSIERRNHKVPAFARITARKLDHDDLSMQVERDEMAFMAGAVVVPDNGIDLEGARVAIGRVVAPIRPPLVPRTKNERDYG